MKWVDQNILPITLGFWGKLYCTKYNKNSFINNVASIICKILTIKPCIVKNISHNIYFKQMQWLMFASFPVFFLYFFACEYKLFSSFIQINFDLSYYLDSLGNFFWDERIKFLQNSRIYDFICGRVLYECNQA